MTTLIGVVENGVGYLAVDRQQTLGNSYSHNCKVMAHKEPAHRIQFCASGAPMIAYPATQVDPPPEGSAPDPAWADRYWQRLLALGHPPLDNDGSLDGNLLVLTPGAVTLIGSTGWPTPIGFRGIALGSGGDFALGAYHARRQTTTDSIEEALKRAVAIATFLSHGSSGGVDVVAL